MRSTAARFLVIVVAGGVVLYVADVALSVPGAPSVGFHYYYFDEQRPLTLDETRIALLNPGPAGAGAILERVGLTAVHVEPWPIAAWSLAAIPGAAGGAAEMAALVERIAASGDVDFVSPVFVGNDGGPVIVTPHILVGFHEDVPPQQAQALLARVVAGQIIERHWAGMHNAYRVRSDSSSGLAVLEAANQLARHPAVKFAEPDMIFTGRGELTPNDTYFSSLWGIHNTGQSGGTPDMDMDGPEAWDITTGDPSIIVVVLDVGVQQDHPDINQMAGADFTGQGGGGGPVNECDDHGTAVAGCVSAIINNSLGVVGIAPDCLTASARPFVSNVPCDGGWNSSASMTVNALAWAETIGARVTNNSNYYGFSSSSIATKYANTRAAGMVHFSSAGNFSSSSITYPANLPTVNAIAALNRNGGLAGFSNWGTGLAFSAPGVSILCTDRTGSDGYVAGDYAWMNGTSFASPYSAGVAALILTVDGSLDADGVELVMQSTAMDLGAVGYDTTYGWGFVNAYDGVAYAGQRGVIYVDADAPGANDGTSWTDAFTDPADAFAQAVLDDQVWMAEGTYTPAGPGGDRTATFEVSGNITVYGGFAGGETVVDQRDVVGNPTILGGDLDGDDGAGLRDTTDNSYHVVTVTAGTPTLDGLIIAGGNANGGGLDSIGGGLTVGGGDLALLNCMVRSNSADLFGGGIFVWNSGAVTLVNCTATGNTADTGGAVYADVSTTTLINSSFSGNTAGSQGGGVYRGSGTMTVTNCVLWGNTDASGSTESAQLHPGTGSVDVNYTCIEGLTGGLGGTGNTGEHPLFADADGADDTFGTADDDLHLQSDSPGIDAGDDAAVPVEVTTDLDGNDRVVNCQVDMGAYEFQQIPDCNTNNIGDGCDIEEGTSPDSNSNGVPDECEGAAAIVSAVSLLDHGGTVLGLDLTANNLEPRSGGVLKMEFEVTGPVGSVSASVSCLYNTYGGAVAATPSGTTVTVEFSLALPDGDCCDITLTGDAEDTFTVRPLSGDIDRNGVVATTDASIIKPRFGETADAGNAKFDYDCNGTIATTDFGLVKPRFGNTACP